MNFLCDIKSNKNNTKGLVIILFYRISAFFTKHYVLRLIGLPIRITYKFFVQWLVGCDIPDYTVIGSGLSVYHGQGLVVHSSVIIGKNCILRQNTTIGVATINGKCPLIGNNVEVGANSIIIGDIIIGDNVIIGAGSVVTKNIPGNCVAVGNPARILRTISKKI